MLRHSLLWLLILVSGIAGALAARTYLQRDVNSLFSYLRDLPEIIYLVDEAYVDDVEMPELMQGAYQGALESLDENASYIPPDVDPAPLSDRIYKFTGMVVNKVGGYGFALSVEPDSPAYEAGLRGGSYIRKIDNLSTRKMSLFEMHYRITKAEDEIKLSIVKANSTEDREITVKPAKFSSSKADHQVMEHQIHLVKVSHNYQNLDQDLRKTLVAITEPNARLVLDLRNNSRGDDDSLRTWAGLFLPKGKVAAWVNARKEKVHILNPEDGEFMNLPLFIVLDRTTSGAAEIFSAMARETLGALVIGEKSMGLPDRYATLPLENGGHISMSTANLELGNGKLLTGKGVEPDHKLKFSSDPEAEDNMLEKALELAHTAELKKAS